MKNFLIKNMGVIAIILAVFSAIQIIAPPRQAHAQIVEDLLAEAEDVLNYLKGALTSVSSEVTAIEQTDETLQDTVLNKIAVAVAKQLLMQITDDVVSWIDSGFNGNPAFIQNPTAFFQNIGDQATVQFISSNGQLSSLCSPFSLQVRLAIAQTQTKSDGVAGGYGTDANGNNLNQYSCTLSSIIPSGQGSVQGFTGGDFSQGGWSAFAALVTQPQNTPNGAYLMAEDALQQKINAQVSQKQTELSQGGGFLSFETCTNNSSGSSGSSGSFSDNSSSQGTDFSVGGDNSSSNSNTPIVGSSDPYNMQAENDPTQNCSIQTPGSVIGAALNRHLAVPTDELLLANSVDDVISDLFTSLITTTLQDGLASLTKTGSGPTGDSYLNDLENEQSSSSPAFQSSQQTTLQAVSGYITIDTQVAQNYDSAFSLASAATTTLGQANSCYQTAQTAVTSASSTLDASTTAAAIAYIQYQIGRVDQQEATITPIVANVSNQDHQADSALSGFTNISSEVENAQNVNDLQQPSAQLESLIQSGGVPVQTNITQSLQDLQLYQTEITPIQAAATNLLSECQAFVPTNSATYNTQ